MKNNHQIVLFFQVLFLWNFSRLWKYIIRNSHYTGGEGDDRGRDGWMASLTQWTCIWVSSRSWWRTGKPGVLQSMGSQRVGHDWATEDHDCWFTSTYWLKFRAGHFNEIKHSLMRESQHETPLENSAWFWKVRQPLPFFSIHQDRRLGLLVSEDSVSER